MSDEERIAELTSCLAHDFKSPIAAIISNAHFLLEGESWDPEMSGAVQDIIGASNFMHRFLLDLEAIAAHAGGKLEAQREKVVLDELLSEVRTQSLDVAREREHRVESRVTPAGAVVSIDRSLIARVLRNLIDNSILHAPSKSSIVIEAKVGPEQELELLVRDRGPRVPPELRERLFSLYGRSERDRLPRIGRGVHLHFCQVAAKVHGGSIGIEDDSPEGTLFRVVLPQSQ